MATDVPNSAVALAVRTIAAERGKAYLIMPSGTRHVGCGWRLRSAEAPRSLRGMVGYGDDQPARAFASPLHGSRARPDPSRAGHAVQHFPVRRGRPVPARLARSPAGRSAQGTGGHAGPDRAWACQDQGGRSRAARGAFTPAGIAALRQLAQDRRQFDPVRYAHVRRELGLAVQAGEVHT